MGTMSTTVLVVGYATCSSLMLVVNKLAVHFLPAPSFVLLAQVTASWVAVKFAGCVGWIDVDELETQKLLSFLPVAAAFLACIFANIKTLQYANVETFIVFRASTPLVIAVAERLMMGRELPNVRSLFALLALVAGATGYVYTDAAFVVRAYVWVGVWYVIFCFDQLYIKVMSATRRASASFRAPFARPAPRALRAPSCSWACALPRRDVWTDGHSRIAALRAMAACGRERDDALELGPRLLHQSVGIGDDARHDAGDGARSAQDDAMGRLPTGGARRLVRSRRRHVVLCLRVPQSRVGDVVHRHRQRKARIAPSEAPRRADPPSHDSYLRSPSHGADATPGLARAHCRRPHTSQVCKIVTVLINICIWDKHASPIGLGALLIW